MERGACGIVEGKWHFNLRLVLEGCPNLGPSLSYPLSMVQSDVKRFGICGYTIYYKHYHGNKLSSKVYSKSLLKGSPLSCTSLE